MTMTPIGSPVDFIMAAERIAAALQQMVVALDELNEKAERTNALLLVVAQRMDAGQPSSPRKGQRRAR